MKELYITVKDKVATYQARGGDIVCGNSDYCIVFNFDEEWSGVASKTARFVWNGQYYDQVFTGNTCTVPIITNADSVEVGVYAGNLRTTTPAKIGCVRSILCRTASPTPEVVVPTAAQTNKAIPLFVINDEWAEVFLDVVHTTGFDANHGGISLGKRILNSAEECSGALETVFVYTENEFFAYGQQLYVRSLTDGEIDLTIVYSNGDVGDYLLAKGDSVYVDLTADIDYIYFMMPCNCA